MRVRNFFLTSVNIATPSAALSYPLVWNGNEFRSSIDMEIFSSSHSRNCSVVMLTYCCKGDRFYFFENIQEGLGAFSVLSG